MTCKGPNCGRTLLRSTTWARMTPDERAAAKARNTYCHEKRGLCSRCVYRTRRDGTHIDYPRKTTPYVDVVEEWRRTSPDHPGESVKARCRRLAPRMGMTPEALERTLYRMGVAA